MIEPNLWKLREPCIYSWILDRGKDDIMLPSGYLWCGARIPKSVKNIVDVETALDRSIPHDILP